MIPLKVESTVGKFTGRLSGYRRAKRSWVCPACIRESPGKVCATCAGPADHCDSRKEADRYVGLLLLQRAQKICELKPHPRYALVVNGVSVGTYIADFSYRDMARADWPRVIEDVKGSYVFQDPASALRRRLAEVLHAITVVLV